MPGCVKKHRRRRHNRHRMPTFNKHKNSITGSPLHHTFSRFTTAWGRTNTLDKCLSPAGLPTAAPGIQRHLKKVYDDFRGAGEKDLTRTRFEAFVRSIQKDERKPRWAFSNRDQFSFEQFLELWWHEYSPAKRPIHPDDKDLDKPISNYFISSSHNTYIEDGNQITGEAKALQYQKVLESGCRCVEIDVWNGSESGEHHELQNQKASKKKHEKHWSFASMLTWMKETCTVTRKMSFPNSLKSKQSQRSLKVRPLPRARPIAAMMDSESVIERLLAEEPRVCHAYPTPAGDLALHEPIPFRNVCKTIRDSAFSHGNELPVIISLEVHANGPQQEKMVEIMREVWGDLLLDAQLAECDPETKQPTLRDLRNKILVKAKTGSQAIQVARIAPARKQSLLRKLTRSISSKAPLQEAKSATVAIPAATAEPDSESTIVASESSASGIYPYGSKPLSLKEDAHCHQKETSNKKIITEALKKLAVYTYSPGQFESFDREDSKKPAHIYSFGEEKLKGLHKTHHNTLFKHNTGYLARTFPESLSSFLSSNPNYPTLFWRKGVQMVALNWQVWDTAMELNDAMFDHERGWVLKPPGYRSSTTSSADCQANVDGKKRLDLTITVLAGQHIPTHENTEQQKEGTARINVSGTHATSFRPRVTCFLHVESAAERDPRKAISKDEIAKSTRVAQTEQPDWGSGGSRLHFSADHVVEELSFLRFHVDHHRRGWSERTAWACIRLDRLQEGYRLVKLRTDDGYRSDGVLLVKIDKKLTDEPRPMSRRALTWNACKKEVSRWSCMK